MKLTKPAQAMELRSLSLVFDRPSWPKLGFANLTGEERKLVR
jgi:hypothetical protein